MMICTSVLRVTDKGNANLTSENPDDKVTAKRVLEEATITEPEKTKQKLYSKIDKELGPGVNDILKQLLNYCFYN